jgi:hypothetical protein
MITIENRETIKRLRSEIASNVAKSRELRAEASAVRGIERHKINNKRRVLGVDTRNRLLLVAYLRERPYLTVERSCRNAPRTHRMAMILEGVGWILKPDEINRVRATNDAIEAWTKVVPAAGATTSPVERAAVAA